MHTKLWLFKLSILKLLITLEFFEKFFGLVEVLLVQVYAESVDALGYISLQEIILRLNLFLQLLLLLRLGFLLLLLGL